MFFITGDKKGDLKEVWWKWCARRKNYREEERLYSIFVYVRVHVCVQGTDVLSLTRAVLVTHQRQLDLSGVPDHPSAKLTRQSFCWLYGGCRGAEKYLIWYKSWLFKLISIFWCPDFLPTEWLYIEAVWQFWSTTRTYKARFSVFLICSLMCQG